jgi:hypothetical protein
LVSLDGEACVEKPSADDHLGYDQQRDRIRGIRSPALVSACITCHGLWLVLDRGSQFSVFGRLVYSPLAVVVRVSVAAYPSSGRRSSVGHHRRHFGSEFSCSTFLREYMRATATPSNQALERTADRRAFTFHMIKTVSIEAEFALGSVRSAWSR